MEDFNQFAKNNNSNANKGMTSEQSLFDLVARLSKQFDGKSQNDLMKAIYEEAKKGKQNGTLTNREIDNFANILWPLLDDKKRKILQKVVIELKKI